MIFFHFYFFLFSQFLKKLDQKKDSCFNFLKLKKKIDFRKKKRVCFDFWNKLDLNIFNKKNFEIMIFFHFYFFQFFQFLKKLD